MLITLGIVVLAYSGISFTTPGQPIQFLGMHIATTTNHFIPPVVGALMLVGGQAAAAGLATFLHCAAGEPELIEADEARITQILVNFLANAIKFTAAGSITLCVTRDPADPVGPEFMAPPAQAA